MQIVTLSMACSIVIAAITSGIMTRKFLKKLDVIDKEYREKMINVVVDVMREKIRRTHGE